MLCFNFFLEIKTNFMVQHLHEEVWRKKEKRELLHSKLVLSFGFGLDIGRVLAFGCLSWIWPFEQNIMEGFGPFQFYRVFKLETDVLLTHSP